MRKIQNSRRARSRNPGGRPQGNNRQRRPQNPANRVFESQGPDGRVKGTPAQLHERYVNAAREIRGSDRILAEALLQHADHYYRLSAEAQEQQNDNRAQAPDAQPQQHTQQETQPDARPEARSEARAEEQADQDNDSGPGPGPGSGSRGRGRRNGAQSAPRNEDGAPDSVNGNGQDAASEADQGGVTEDQIPMLRKRGRPRKTAETPENSDTSKGSPETGESEERPAPKRRGRPRKVDAAQSGTDGEAKPAPKRRGRPRKSETAAGDAAGVEAEPAS